MHRLFAPEFQEAHPDLMRDRRDAFLKTDPDVFRAACNALAELDLRPELKQVKVPTLVLVGEHDEATPPPMSHELAAGLPNARLNILPGCAHVPQLQSPEMFLAAIGDFLTASHAAI
jgi:3-oxoadipate enol-lactonase